MTESTPSVSEAVQTVNEDVTEDYVIDYRFASGHHILTLRALPEVSIRTKDDNRALNFVTFYSVGTIAGMRAEKQRRTEEDQRRVEETPEPSFLDRILRRNV